MKIVCFFFRYKCHKNCAAQAPPSCGLPKELMNFFRKHINLASSTERLAEQRVDPQVQSPMEWTPSRPPMERSSTFDLDTRDQFYIPDLASEPTTSKEPDNLDTAHAHTHSQIRLSCLNYCTLMIWLIVISPPPPPFQLIIVPS